MYLLKLTLKIDLRNIIKRLLHVLEEKEIENFAVIKSTGAKNLKNIFLSFFYRCHRPQKILL